MSHRSVPAQTKQKLWLQAAGRCEYEGCNIPLWQDELTMVQMNKAYVAHIIADKPNGPRGDAELSPLLCQELSNLMLLCDTHHRLIDHEEVELHPVERLTRMKRDHEERIEVVTGISPNRKSEVVLYGANIGAHTAPVNNREAFNAMIPQWYPACVPGIHIGMVNSALEDCEPAFWEIEANNLMTLFSERVKARVELRNINHLSIFAIAPQPLLMLLGYLISDITPAEIYQCHREPTGWAWQEHPEGFEYRIMEPEEIHDNVALSFSLSGNIRSERITQHFDSDVSIWNFTIDAPNNDFLKSREQLRMFRESAREILNRIKTKHGEDKVLHVFPAMPVAAAVEFGRVHQPKADLPLRIYDQNRRLDGFEVALN